MRLLRTIALCALFFFPLLAGCKSGKSVNQQPDGGCANGYVGPGCDHCTWSADGTACSPMSPRDQFDITAIRQLSLADLGWSLTATTVYEGVTVLKGYFSGGTFKAYDANGNPQTLDLNYAAAVYLPDGWPRPDDKKLAFVSAVHYETKLFQLPAARIAKFLRIPVLYHGQLRDWVRLGYSERGKLYADSRENMITNNPCEPVDMVRGYFPWAMALADMRAITLAQRLAEQKGAQVDRVAFRGFSKEGAAGWLAAAVDPRIEVMALGGFQEQDTLKAAHVKIESWGCEGGASIAEPTQPKPSPSWSDWLNRSPAGAAFLNLYCVEHNKGLLYPRFVIIDSDVTSYGMHDQIYALGGETPFLEGLTDISWRYVRKATITSGATDDDGDEVAKAVVPYLLVENLVKGSGSENTDYPKVTGASARIESDQLIVTAQASSITESMALWWSWSDDRVWNDTGQTAWSEVPMTRGAGDSWSAPSVAVPPGKVIGWYVEARNTVTVAQKQLTRTDAGPVRFLRLPAPLSCPPQDLADWCAGTPGG